MQTVQGRLCAELHREACDAMMEMNRGMLRALTGVERDDIELAIDKSLAACDDCCQGTVRLRGIRPDRCM